MDFTNRVIIVTGAARGIGRCHAELLASRGAALVVADSGGDPEGGGQSSAPGEEVVQGIVAKGGRAINVVASVATEEGAGRIVAAALDNFGRLDGLVNNAGIIRMSSFEEASAELYRSHYEVHMIGTMLVSKAAWPHLVASGAGGGGVHRMVMVSSPGIQSDALTPEEVAARIDEIMDIAKAEATPLDTPEPATA